MRAARIACGVAIIGLGLVPAGCGSAEAGSSSERPPSGAAQVGHPEDAPDADASSTTVAPPTRLDIEASEFGWNGLPDELPAGTYPMSFHNAGAEAHEISIFRNDDDIPLEDLFALGPDGLEDAVETVGFLIAGPGASADQEATVTLTPGEYDVVCFIPTPTDGQPHFQHGMHRTLVVR